MSGAFPIGKICQITDETTKQPVSYAGRPEAAACELSSHQSPGMVSTGDDSSQYPLVICYIGYGGYEKRPEK